MPHTYCIDTIFVGHHPQATARASHVGDEGPLSGFRVVAFSRRQAATPIEAPAHVDLQTDLDRYI